jgi:hypothetical protein
LLSTISQRLSAKMRQYLSIFSEAQHFCLTFEKTKAHRQLLKTLSGASPISALSNHTTFSLTQTSATVPLKSKTLLKYG